MHITIRKLKKIISEAVTSKYPTSAAEYAKQLNDKSRTWAADKPDAFYSTMPEDQDYWSGQGINTGEELAHDIASTSYSDLYKSIHGIRPRWVKFDEMSVEQIDKMISDLEGDAHLYSAGDDVIDDFSDLEDEEVEEPEGAPVSTDDGDYEYDEYENLPMHSSMRRG